MTVRKTPPGRPPFDPKGVREAIGDDHTAGMVAYQLVDDVAESYLNLVDDLNDEIDELEDAIESWPGPRIRSRLSALRHDMLQIRRTLAPTRDAVRRVVDNRVDLEGGVEVFSTTSSCTSPTPTTSSCARRRRSSSAATWSPAPATTTRRWWPRTRTRS